MEEFIRSIFSEYGGLVTILIIEHIALAKFIEVIWKRNSFLSDKLVEIVQENIRVITTLSERIGHCPQQHGGDS